MRRALSLLALAIPLATACATTREEKFDAAPATAAAPEATEAATGLVAEGDALWAERTDREKLKAALAKWEEAFKAAPGGELAVKLSRGHYFLADGHYALDPDEENRDAHYNLGTEWGERAIGLMAPGFVTAKKAGEKVPDALKKAPAEAAPAFYWWATNLGKWAAGKGLMTLLKYKDDVKATIDHVAATDEGFFYGAAHRYLGAYHAKAPGGSLEASETHFKKAVEMAPDYLGTKVLWADYLCTKQRDRATYKRLLEEVLAADANSNPDIAAENAVEQKKAQKLLADIDDLFGPES